MVSKLHSSPLFPCELKADASTDGPILSNTKAAAKAQCLTATEQISSKHSDCCHTKCMVACKVSLVHAHAERIAWRQNRVGKRHRDSDTIDGLDRAFGVVLDASIERRDLPVECRRRRFDVA